MLDVKFLNNKMWWANSWIWKNVIVDHMLLKQSPTKVPTNLSHNGFWHRQGTAHCFFSVGRSSTLGGTIRNIQEQWGVSQKVSYDAWGVRAQRAAGVFESTGSKRALKTWVRPPLNRHPDLKHSWRAFIQWAWLQEHLPRQGVFSSSFLIANWTSVQPMESNPSKAMGRLNLMRLWIMSMCFWKISFHQSGIFGYKKKSLQNRSSKKSTAP